MGRHSGVAKWTDKCGQHGGYPIVGSPPCAPHFRVGFQDGMVGPRGAPTAQPQTRAQPNRHHHPCPPEQCSCGCLCHHFSVHVGPVALQTAACHPRKCRSNGASVFVKSTFRTGVFPQPGTGGLPP
jgi:hypothetical protein